MAQKLSQVYDVDNRFKEAKGVADNTAGKKFLQEFRARDKSLGSNFIGDSRKSDDRFILHEGAKVSILEVIEGWYEIRLADGKRGWVPSNILGVI